MVKRIAIVAGVLHLGGKRNLIMEYYRHIDRTKVQFDFVCDSDSNGIPREEIEFLGGRIYIVSPYKHLFSHMIETYKVLRGNKYHVMHAYDNTLNLFPMFVGWCAGVKVRVSESISKGDRNEKKTMVKYILRLFSHCFATDYMANSIDCGKWQFGEKTYKNGKVNIFKTVINATENAFVPALRESARTEFGWNKNVVYGFIGRYVSQKNPLFLIDIFNEIAKKQENAILVMIGFGNLEPDIMKRVNEYDLSDRVHNLGRRDDLRQFYNAFDAFLLPSLYEGMPVVGVEAQCYGLPVFFSKNITEETTACELANYISLNVSPTQWADVIVEKVVENMKNRRSRIDDIIMAGFDSKSEAQRLQNFYEKKYTD